VAPLSIHPDVRPSDMGNGSPMHGQWQRELCVNPGSPQASLRSSPIRTAPVALSPGRPIEEDPRGEVVAGFFEAVLASCREKHAARLAGRTCIAVDGRDPPVPIEWQAATLVPECMAWLNPSAVISVSAEESRRHLRTHWMGRGFSALVTSRSGE
jgi:hypothetical protein